MNSPIQKYPESDLFSDAAYPRTPIAVELRAHFERGGTTAEGVRLVEMLERMLSRSPAKRKPAANRGSRLLPNWCPSEGEIWFAVNRGLPRARAFHEAEKFKNYWTSKTGITATKLDWSATWRNWILTVLENSHGHPTNSGHAAGALNPSRRVPTGPDAILAGMGKLARRIDERRFSDDDSRREAQNSSNTPRELDLEPRRTR